jgi:CDP-glucose 4,6-dehydratase
MDPEFWRGRRVLVTGHTGFKGAWLCAWLEKMGAVLKGVALPPETDPSLFTLLGLSERFESELFDIADGARLTRSLTTFQPEVVLHLAAQAIVRASYDAPVATFATNVVGTAALLEAVRRTPSVKSVVIVTSDKCYENREWKRGYREDDRLGGRDPYSASKGCAEIVARSMQLSFFVPYAPKGHPARISTVRAGNVIGGGDWSRDRLIPDIVRGCLGSDGVVDIRNPGAVRPWQHVLEPLAGYLCVAERLTIAPDGVDQPWNFGPDDSASRPVLEVARAIVEVLGRGRIEVPVSADAPHEAQMLYLDSTKARQILGWQPLFDFDEAIGVTAAWYLAWARGENVRTVTSAQIDDYLVRVAKTGNSRAGSTASQL